MEELIALIVGIAVVACGLNIADDSWSRFAREHEARLSSNSGSGDMTRGDMTRGDMTRTLMAVHARIAKWQPPDIVFRIIWPLLYGCLALSLVFAVGNLRTTPRKGRSFLIAGIALFGIQLLLNAAWSPVFLRAQSFVGAFVIIVLLFISALLATVFFIHSSKVSGKGFTGTHAAAGWLLIPYLIWIGFATALTTFYAFSSTSAPAPPPAPPTNNTTVEQTLQQREVITRENLPENEVTSRGMPEDPSMEKPNEVMTEDPSMETPNDVSNEVMPSGGVPSGGMLNEMPSMEKPSEVSNEVMPEESSGGVPSGGVTNVEKPSGGVTSAAVEKQKRADAELGF